MERGTGWIIPDLHDVSRREYHLPRGDLREVVPPENWCSPGSGRIRTVPRQAPKQLVTVEFHDLGEKTEILLVHERFPDAEARDAHEKGWSSSLECLEELF